MLQARMMSMYEYEIEIGSEMEILALVFWMLYGTLIYRYHYHLINSIILMTNITFIHININYITLGSLTRLGGSIDMIFDIFLMFKLFKYEYSESLIK